MPYGLCGSLVSILPACKCRISRSVWTSAWTRTSPSAATCLPALMSPVVSLQTPHGQSPPLPLDTSFAFSKSHTPFPLQHCGLGNRSNEMSSHPVLTSSPSPLLNPNSLPSCSERRDATIFQILVSASWPPQGLHPCSQPSLPAPLQIISVVNEHTSRIFHLTSPPSCPTPQLP